MTLPARTSIASITYAVPSGSASSGDTYNITYNFLNNDEFVNVWYRNANGEKVELTLDSDFKIDISSGTNNVYGVCVLLKDIPDITSVTLERSIAISQDIDFNNSTLYPSTTEYAFDKLTAISQDQNFKSYTIHAPSDEVVTDPRKFELPPEEERLGKIIGFNGEGKVAMYDPPESGQTGYTPATRTTLGAVIIGDKLTVENSGLINIPVASETNLGVVKVGTGIDLNDGKISVDIATPKAMAEEAKYKAGRALGEALIARNTAESAKDTADKTADLFDWYVDGQWVKDEVAHYCVASAYGAHKFVVLKSKYADPTAGTTNQFLYSDSIKQDEIDWAVKEMPLDAHWKSIVSGAAPIGQNWQPSSIQPTSHIKAMCQVDTRIVGVGLHGVAAYSDDDGITWHSVTNIPTGQYVSVTNVGTNVVVAVGHRALSGAAVMFSTDKGKTWQTPTTLPAVGSLSAVTTLGARVIAVGEEGVCLYSDDYGDHWTQATSFPNVPVFDIVAINSRVIVTAQDGTVKAWYSDDGGDHWTASTTSIGNEIVALTTKGSRVIGVGLSGYAWYSDDYGDNWTQATTAPTEDVECVTTFRNSVLLATGFECAFYSDDDGENWSPASFAPKDASYGLFSTDNNIIAATNASNKNIQYSTEKVVAFAATSDEGIVYSFGGIDWNSVSVSGTYDLVTYLDGEFFAVGNQRYAYSSALNYWQSSIAPWSGTTPTFLIADNFNYYVGFNNSTTAYKGSSLGFSTITLPSGMDVMTFAKGKLVGLKGGNAYYSSDGGDNWATVSLPAEVGNSQEWVGLKFGGNRFLAISKTGTVIYSTDATSWNAATNSLPNYVWRALDYGGDRFLAICSSEYIAFKISLDIVDILDTYFYIEDLT